MAAFRKRDLLWLFAFPLYLTLGTIRHEGSHALVALLEGGDVYLLLVVPTPAGWGGVAMNPEYVGGWAVNAAPYLAAAFFYAVFFALLMLRPFRRHWLWLNLVIVGPLSSLIDTANNYLAVLLVGKGDFANLETLTSPFVVHTVIPVLLCLYLYGLFLIVRGYIRFQRTLPAPVPQAASWRRRALVVAGAAAGIVAFYVGIFVVTLPINIRGLALMLSQAEPLVAQPFTATPEETDAVMKRIEAFQAAAEAGEAEEALVFSEREVNVLANGMPGLRDLVCLDMRPSFYRYLKPQSGSAFQLRSRILLTDSSLMAEYTASSPAHLPGRYYNGTLTFHTYVCEEKLHLEATSVNPHLNTPPKRILPLRQPGPDFATVSPEVENLGKGVDRLEITDHTLVLHAKGSREKATE